MRHGKMELQDGEGKHLQVPTNKLNKHNLKKKW